MFCTVQSVVHVQYNNTIQAAQCKTVQTKQHISKCSVFCTCAVQNSAVGDRAKRAVHRWILMWVAGLRPLEPPHQVHHHHVGGGGDVGGGGCGGDDGGGVIGLGWVACGRIVVSRKRGTIPFLK